MKTKSYAPTYNAKLKLTKRVVNTPNKVIKTRKSINNKLANIQYFVDSDKKLINIDRDKKKVQELLINNLKTGK